MFRPAIVLTLLVGAVLGCSKKNDSSNLEGGGDPNATYTLTFRTAKMEWDLAWFEKYLKK